MSTTAIPDFLQKEFISQILFPENVGEYFVKSLQIERNSTGGNYSSDIYRVKVQYAEKEESSQIKVVNLLFKDLFESLAARSQEYFTYTELLPVMDKMLVTAGIERPALAPKLYFARKTPTELHVFKDMNAAGYKVCDRLKGFNLAESKTVMKKLAHFHATSMIVMKKHPELLSQLSEYFWLGNEQFSVFVKLFIDENIKHIAKMFSAWPRYQKIAEKLLQNTGEKFEQKFVEIFDKSNCKIRVILHGDLWIKNILIHADTQSDLEYDSRSVDDALFIDYQNCFEGSPAIDIHNVLMTSMQLNVIQNNGKDLVELYYKTLCNTLEKCNAIEETNVFVPTYEALLSELARTEYFKFYALIFAFAQTNLSEDLAQDMNYGNLFEPERLARNREDMFSNPRVIETVKFVLDDLDKSGFLD